MNAPVQFCATPSIPRDHRSAELIGQSDRYGMGLQALAHEDGINCLREEFVIDVSEIGVAIFGARKPVAPNLGFDAAAHGPPGGDLVERFGAILNTPRPGEPTV